MDVSKVVARMLAHAPTAAVLGNLAPEVVENIKAGWVRLIEEEITPGSSDALVADLAKIGIVSAVQVQKMQSELKDALDTVIELQKTAAPAPAAKPPVDTPAPPQTSAEPGPEAPAAVADPPAFPRAVTEHDVKFMVAHGYDMQNVAMVENYLSRLNVDDLRGFFAGSDAWVEGTPVQ